MSWGVRASRFLSSLLYFIFTLNDEPNVQYAKVSYNSISPNKLFELGFLLSFRLKLKKFKIQNESVLKEAASKNQQKPNSNKTTVLIGLDDFFKSIYF